MNGTILFRCCKSHKVIVEEGGKKTEGKKLISVLNKCMPVELLAE